MGCVVVIVVVVVGRYESGSKIVKEIEGDVVRTISRRRLARMLLVSLSCIEDAVYTGPVALVISRMSSSSVPTPSAGRNRVNLNIAIETIAWRG